MKDLVINKFLSGYTSIEISQKYSVPIEEIASILSNENENIFVVHKINLRNRVKEFSKSLTYKEMEDILHLPKYKIEELKKF